MVNIWRSGKFMDLIDRSTAVNSNILGKLWYRAASVSLRKSDYKTITKLLKQYIYQDLQIRPSDQALYWPVMEGGLGLLHTESRCQAVLIRSFIETAVGGKYAINATNAELYRQKVLNEQENFKIEFSPYYNRTFFDIIKYIKKNADKQIHDLTLKELYNIILKKNVLHDSEGNKLPLHGERTMGWIDWEMTWRMLRTRGIPPKVSSTMWKILYNILPTNEKLDIIKNGVNKGVCTLCPNKIDNIYHSLTECINSKNAAELLLKIVKYLHNPAIMYDIVYLQYNTNNILDLPITWIVATGFHLKLEK